mmetsp:Transcript_50823/g.99385  ORF Transcript_50823/g.99385 Transcript_50823/m.99385 type:complete len:225 (+) Transcript_50823:1657-2331(+)
MREDGQHLLPHPIGVGGGHHRAPAQPRVHLGGGTLLSRLIFARRRPRQRAAGVRQGPDRRRVPPRPGHVVGDDGGVSLRKHLAGASVPRGAHGEARRVPRHVAEHLLHPPAQVVADAGVGGGERVPERGGEQMPVVEGGQVGHRRILEEESSEQRQTRARKKDVGRREEGQGNAVDGLQVGGVGRQRRGVQRREKPGRVELVFPMDGIGSGRIRGYSNIPCNFA